MAFRGGVFVACGDVDGDGRAEVITGAGAGGGSHVRIFAADGRSLGLDYMAYDGSTGGVRVAAVDVDGDGRAEVVTTPPPSRLETVLTAIRPTPPPR